MNNTNIDQLESTLLLRARASKVADEKKKTSCVGVDANIVSVVVIFIVIIFGVNRPLECVFQSKRL